MKVLDNQSQQQQIVYRNQSLQVNCEFCNNVTQTVVQNKATYLGFVLFLISLTLFGQLYGFLSGPFIFWYTKNNIHKCQYCDNEIGEDNQIISGYGVQNKLLDFHIGEFGFMLTLRILISIIFSFIFIGLLVNRANTYHLSDKRVNIDKQWTQFYVDCQNNDDICQETYNGKSIYNWSGYIQKIKDNRRFRYEFVKSAIVVYVKMDLSNDNEKVDLTLEIDSRQALFLEDNLDHYQRGNRIGFNATILRIGTNDETRKFKLLEIWEEEGFKELPEFVTHDGRYEIETGKKSFRNF